MMDDGSYVLHSIFIYLNIHTQEYLITAIT